MFKISLLSMGVKKGLGAIFGGTVSLIGFKSTADFLSQKDPRATEFSNFMGFFMGSKTSTSLILRKKEILEGRAVTTAKSEFAIEQNGLLQAEQKAYVRKIPQEETGTYNVIGNENRPYISNFEMDALSAARKTSFMAPFLTGLVPKGGRFSYLFTIGAAFSFLEVWKTRQEDKISQRYQIVNTKTGEVVQSKPQTFGDNAKRVAHKALRPLGIDVPREGSKGIDAGNISATIKVTLSDNFGVKEASALGAHIARQVINSELAQNTINKARETEGHMMKYTEQRVEEAAEYAKGIVGHVSEYALGAFNSLKSQVNSLAWPANRTKEEKDNGPKR